MISLSVLMAYMLVIKVLLKVIVVIKYALRGSVFDLVEETLPVGIVLIHANRKHLPDRFLMCYHAVIFLMCP